MPRQLKLSALITFVLAILFYLFFQISKHNLALAQVNAFAEDPYDAVGSYGVQLALFTALLSLVRAFRPYQAQLALDIQKLQILRGECMSFLAVAVTLVADIVAMLRYPSLWIGLPGGQMLAALLGGLALLTALVGWLIFSFMRTIFLPVTQRHNAWTRAIIIVIVGIVILALYPENVRQGISGALFTVVVGMVILIGAIWAIEMALAPSQETQFEDFIDDLTAVYRWLKAHSGPFVVLFTIFDKLLNLSFVRPLLGWLNPRKHPWNVVILLGIFIGIALALVEILVEGGSPQIGQLALVLTVFASLEGLGMALGYALLAKPLGLFRQDSAEKLTPKIN